MRPLQAARVNEHLSVDINFGFVDELYQKEQQYICATRN